MTEVVHDSALTHVTGRSEYIDDRPMHINEAHVGLIYSEHARAEILGSNRAEIEKHPGVLGIFSFEDFDHLNWGTIFQDQPLAVHREAQFVGEVVLIIAADSHLALRSAMKQTKLRYRIQPHILTISDAIKKRSFIGPERAIIRGDWEKELDRSRHRLKGELEIRGADHFYLEGQCAVVYPNDRGGLEVHSSAQHPTEVQHVVAHALGLSYNEVTCIVKRMGGAFGGKESQAAPIAAYAALVAKKLNRPARIVLTKDDDMIMTGKRNPFLIRYDLGFDEIGKIRSADFQLFSNGGAYADLSTSIMERAMLHCDNAYFLPAVRIRGQVCKINVHPHTAFRGFGGPKGVALIEMLLEKIGQKLKIDSLDVRLENIYRSPEQTTPFGQSIRDNCLAEVFKKIETSSEYRKRRAEIDLWNRDVLRKVDLTRSLRGLSITAVKFGISFTTRFLNQGNALIHIHRDGSVQVSTGATEMGQGVNTRISQLVAEQLGLNVSEIQILPTSTDRNANTSPTAASSGTDINGAAAVKACLPLKQRLAYVYQSMLEKPKERWAVNTAGLGTEEEVEIIDFERLVSKEILAEFTNPNRRKFKFSEVVNEAYLNRISLSEYSHFKIQNLEFNKLTGKGPAFLYFTQGVAATEISIDQISGEVKVLRTDILMDLGRPINRGLDEGQISGAFVQGLGWVTTENCFYSAEGKLLSHSPSTYKIPSIQDTPRVFNIDLIANDKNTVNVRGTKAVGEPPLLLAISAWTAIQNALSYKNERVDISIPATSEAVLRALYPNEF